MVRKILILCFLTFGHLAFGQSLETQVDSLFSSINKPDVPGAAVVIMRGDSVHFSKGYGIANLEYNIPVTPETVFLVASVSKQFTAYGIALLATHGKISLNAPVTDYIPELNAFTPPITTQHLVYHTSGLRDEFGLLSLTGYRMDDVITKENILRLIYRQRALNFDPGTEYLYSNSGYTLLAEIIERVSGQSFSDWTRDSLFLPLGMTKSQFRSEQGTVIPNVASGYITAPNGYKAQRVNYSSVGASGLYTTALDLGKWLTALKHGTIGGEETRDLAHTRGVLTNGDTLAYAFGLTHGQFRGTRSIGHSGSHRGFRAWAGRFPEYDLGIVVLGNLEEFNPSDMAMKIAGLFINDKHLNAYEGTYHSEELGSTLYITMEADTLHLHSRRGRLATLSRTGLNSFYSDAWYLSTLEFKQEGDSLLGFSASSGRTNKVWFKKLNQ